MSNSFTNENSIELNEGAERANEFVQVHSVFTELLELHKDQFIVQAHKYGNDTFATLHSRTPEGNGTYSIDISIEKFEDSHPCEVLEIGKILPHFSDRDYDKARADARSFQANFVFVDIGEPPVTSRNKHYVGRTEMPGKGTVDVLFTGTMTPDEAIEFLYKRVRNVPLKPNTGSDSVLYSDFVKDSKNDLLIKG